MYHQKTQITTITLLKVSIYTCAIDSDKKYLSIFKS